MQYSKAHPPLHRARSNACHSCFPWTVAILIRWHRGYKWYTPEYVRYILAILQVWKAQGVAVKPWIEKMYPSVRSAVMWQLNRSSACGLPTRLETSYDWFGFANADVAAYNAFMHIASLKAAGVLAAVIGDEELGPALRVGVERAQAAVAGLLWREPSSSSPASYYRATASLPASGRRGSSSADTLLTDTLYGQAWAHHLGLGWLIPADTVRDHLASELLFSGTAQGLLVMFNATTPRSRYHDNMYWEGGSFGWSVLQLYSMRSISSSKGGIEQPEHSSNVRQYKDAMGPGAHAVLTKYHVGLADIWNWRDLSAGPNTPCLDAVGGASSARPWCNGHYGRQLVGWMLPNAVAGLGLTRGNVGAGEHNHSASLTTIRFDPVVGAPATILFVGPGALGVLVAASGSRDDRVGGGGSDRGSGDNTDSYWSSPMRLDGNGGSAGPRIEIVAGKLCVNTVQLVGRPAVTVPASCVVAGSSILL